MNCQDALDLLHEIIDREASEIDTQKVKEHLEKCHHCFEVYRLEESIQDFLKEKIEINKRAEDNSPKLESLKSKIMLQLDDIDHDCSTPEKKTGFFNLSTKSIVAAATLVFFIAAAFFSSHLIRHGTYYGPLEKAHFSAEEDMVNFQDDNKTSLIKESLQNDHEMELISPVNGFMLVGGHNEEVMGVNMNHLLYKNNGDLVSVFIVPSSEFEIPSDLDKTAFVRDHITFFDHNCRGCRLVYHTVGDLIFITATTNKDIDLLQFVPEKELVSSVELKS